MKSFASALKALNPAQRQAVQTIDGPVLVVAGPGTGKTQLLSMRAANIVQQTDTAPQSILCLTFTESAATAMQQRLVKLMGAEGNKVAVHTFHSLGAEVINQHPAYFHNGARFAPANDIASYEILRAIFEKLPHNNPLAKTMNGEFSALRSVQQAISHLKRAGLTPEELAAILDHNHTFCDQAEPLLSPLFANRLSKKDFAALDQAASNIATMAAGSTPLALAPSLATVCSAELTKAVASAQASGKTTAITAWRNRWLEKNARAVFVFKDRARTKKLKALIPIYQQYRQKLAEAELFDFDDMVSLVAHTLESTPELRYALQEQFLYIMVDEFQDTNGAQARLLAAIAENPVNEDRPNILAVGDDDQAIYSFQGAELSNILDFASRYRDVRIITLTENYRSTAAILRQARSVITLGTQRLETTLQHINKELSANYEATTTTDLHQFQTAEAEYEWVAKTCRTYIAQGTPPNEIAILGRNHKHLQDILPYMHAAGLRVSYERRNNVLDNPHVQQLITLAQTVVALGDQRFDTVESLLPELLSYPFWGISTTELWRLSLRAFKERRMWLELMLETDGQLHHIAEFLIVSSHQALHEPVDAMLDILLGSHEPQLPETEASEAPAQATGPAEGFTSPLRAYFFSADRFTDDPQTYLTLLSHLRTLRSALQQYRPNSLLTLADFVDFIDLHIRTNTTITNSTQHIDAAASVQLMTAHKAKGLEFACVFVVGCQDDTWGRKARHPASQLSFPHNLPIEPAGNNYNDALRLFFVAITRAKQHLVLTSHTINQQGKESLLAEFLQTEAWAAQFHKQAGQPASVHSPGWEQRWLQLKHTSQTTLLQPTLETYKLSATHVNNFIDLSRGGPQAFLLQNLLRFPQAMSPAQAFGHAIHAVLQRAHTHLSATGEPRPVEDILHDFEIQLTHSRLSERDYNYQLEKGSEVLQNYLATRLASFTPQQKAERNFYGQNVTLGPVRLTGAIDLMEVDTKNKTVTVIDYKTGKSFTSWRGASDYDKIKLHKYKQQLMLYKLLVEGSRDFAGYTVTKGVLDFVEPDPGNQLHQLELTYSAEELAEFKKLLAAIWRKIMALDFPDVTNYEPTYGGIIAFERHLLDGSAS